MKVKEGEPSVGTGEGLWDTSTSGFQQPQVIQIAVGPNRTRLLHNLKIELSILIVYHHNITWKHDKKLFSKKDTTHIAHEIQ